MSGSSKRALILRRFDGGGLHVQGALHDGLTPLQASPRRRTQAYDSIDRPIAKPVLAYRSATTPKTNPSIARAFTAGVFDLMRSKPADDQHLLGQSDDRDPEDPRRETEHCRP